jgi:hypothetical protein
VVTRGLSVLGVELGQNLLPAQADNVKGFWEDREIVEINTALMNSCGQDWQTFGALDVSWQSEMRERARDYIREVLKEVDVWGFKDPRTARLLPFWNSVFNSLQINPSYCLVVRHPLSVAESLQRRNGFTALRSSLLWYQYSMDMLAGLGDGSFTLVDYDEFLEGPTVELQRIAKQLGLDGEVDEHACTEYCAHYLSAELRHSRHGLDNLSDNDVIPEEVAELYRYLLELKGQGNNASSSDFRHRVTEWEERQRVCHSLFGLVNEYGACEERLRSCEQSVNQCEDRLHIAVEHVEQTLQERDAVIAEVGIHQKRHEMALVSLDQAQQEMRGVKYQLKEQARQLNEQTRQLDELMNSTSWKITRPLRAVAELLKDCAAIFVERK